MNLLNLKRAVVAAVAAVMAFGPASSTFANPANTDATRVAPIVGASATNAIRDRYIVVLNTPKGSAQAASVRANVVAAAKGMGANVHYEYSNALNGFAATLNANALAALQKNPNVAYIEADQIVTIDAAQSPATWGLDRIDQRALPLNNTYNYNTTASNVNAYIIDTGIKTGHTEFGGRAVKGYDAVTSGGSAEDCNGHGTHVAGTVGGSTYGVAKGVKLYAVRVLDCAGSGTNAGVIAGVDWVTNNHVKPAVANMSLGGGASSALDTAVSNSINAGVVYAIAAGNSNQDACRFSPARVANGITVGATTSTDARASYSNYGACLDIFAPGSSITSAWYTSNSALNTISGTSMAAPHVAGVAALYLAANPGATPTTVRNAIVNGGTTGKVTNPGRKSTNVLLYSLVP